MDRQALAEKLDVASKKVAKLGVKLSWNWGNKFYLFEKMFPTHEIKEKDEYQFNIGKQGTFVVQQKLRQGISGEDCRLLALGAFNIPGRFGNTEGRDIKEGGEAANCSTENRTDACCNIVNIIKDKMGSSVIHRDVWPNYAFRYILPHEIGHYLGLCHFGHDGVQNIMFQLSANSILDGGLLKFYYESEPEFTLDDGKNAWRFICNQLACCLSDKNKCMPQQIQEPPRPR